MTRDSQPTRSAFAPRLSRALLLGTVSAVAMQVMPVMAEVTAVTGTGTSVSASTGAITVQTTNIRSGTAFNQFEKFNVGAADNVSMFQPASASALVNIVRSGGGASTIAGPVTVRQGNPTASLDTANVYFVNSDGFVVSATGSINANHLTLSTPTSDFVTNLTDEADGNVTIGTPTQTLFAGGEPLNPNGAIEIHGDINAARLDMRAGLRMIVDGRVTVNANPSTGRIDPAVNVEGVPTAGGVQIGAGGVIRLVSGGAMTVRGQVSAKGKAGGVVDHGGLIEGIADGDLTLGGSIDVSNGAGDAGSVMMYTKGSAIMEPALTVTANSTSGAGGFFALRAVNNVTVQGDVALNTSSTSGSAGEAFLLGENVTVSGKVTTDGGSIGLRALRKVTLDNGAGVSTRGAGAGDAFSGAPAAAKAGDILVAAREIELNPNSSLRADGAGADNGGFVGLFARNTNTGIAWAINPEAEVAKVTLDQASITGGAVAISAVAKASNSLGDPDDAVEATQVTEMEAATPEAKFEQMLDSTLDTIVLAMERGITTVNGLIPVQVQVLTADAEVSITDSQITANGNWDPIAPSQTDTLTEFAANGYLGSAGLREDTYEFLAASSYFQALMGDDAYQMNIRLPSVFDPASDSLLIHSHAETTYSIAPKVYGLGVGVAVTDTKSRVSVTDSALTTTDGNIRMASSASEVHSTTISAKKIANGAAAVVVQVRNLTNQIAVKGGSVTSAGGLSFGAFTGRSLSSSTVANAGQEGRLGIAVSVDITNGLTEAALGGTVNTGGAVDVDAETLFFDITHVTTATMGLGNPAKAIANARANNNKTSSFAQQLRARASGKTPDPARASHFGLGVAVDLQLGKDVTNATVGGSYHQFDDPGAALLTLGATSVTASGQAVTVNAAYRFADRGNEGGGGFTRSTSAAFGKLTFALKKMVERHNAKYPGDQVTEDQLLGRFSNALMMNVSLSSMVGETTAEIGADAQVTAGTLTVNALTRYPHTNPVQDLADQWDTYVDQVTNYQPVQAAGAGDPPELAAPPAPDLAGFIDIVNPLTYLTTDSKAKGEAPVAGDTAVVPGDEQALAIGLTLTYFNTDNKSTAVIRDGATVTLDTAAEVSASQEAVFLHATNLPKKNPIGGTAKVNDAIGGGIHFGRTVSEVRAEIESGATVTVNSGDLDVTATTRNIAASLAFSGGQGSDVAVNASIAAQVSEATTIARVGEAARITAEDVRITARDSSFNLSTAGAITGSENVGVGASGVFNFNTRKIWAGIGPADRTATLAAASGTVVDATSLTVLAENQAHDITVGVAGTKVVGKPDPAPDQTPPPNDDQDDMIIPTWLFDDDENDAASQQQSVNTPEDQQGGKQKSGWAVSGAAVLNLTLANETSAEILTNDKINLAAGLDVTARNSSVAVNVGGAVSAGLGAGKDTNALAGAFAVQVDTRILRSRIVGAEINAGDVLVKADDQATVVNIAVGGAGTSRGDIALAGSVAVAVLDGETTAELLDARLTSSSLTLDADDSSTTVSVGGAVGVNMDATQGYGVGVGVAVNTVTRSAMASVSGGGFITTGALSVAADTTQDIYAFAVSAGVGKTGLAGSVTVNTITGGAKAHVKQGTGTVNLPVMADSLSVTATENNTIFALGGALAGGRSTAVGAAITVNVITATTEARLDDATVTANTGDLGAVVIDSDSTSTITTIAVAGAAAINGDAAGVGLSANEITATSLASLARSSVTDAASLTATASGARTIRSLGGGVAASGRGAAGVAATLNLLLGNTTKVVLDGAMLTTRDSGALTATATAGGEIASLAAGISASKDTSIGGAVTVNVTTAETGVSADGATLTADGALALSATDSAAISSLAGGAAFSAGGNAIGGAVAANFISHETNVLANGGGLTGEGISLDATNGATIQSMAVGLAGGSSNAFSGSIAIGDIGNTTRAQAAGSTLTGGTGALTINAGSTGDIDILAGSAAVGGSNAVGGALTVATIHNTVTADLITGQPVTGTSLSVTGTRSGSIDALAVSGAAGLGGAGVAGSFVYTQIGKPPVDGPTVEPLPGDSDNEKPLEGAQTTVASARDDAIIGLATSIGSGSGTSLSASDMALALDTDDVLRARVELAGTAPELPALTITATDTAATRSLAGAVAGGSSAGVGAGIAVNLLFGKAEAELVLPTGESATIDGGATLSVTQTGSVETAGVAGGGGGSVGGAGSIIVNVMNRKADARLVAAAPGTGTQLATQGGDVRLSVTQGGTITSIAGAVGIGGSGGVGGAIVVNVMSDDAGALIEDVEIDTAATGAAPANPLGGAGAVAAEASQTMTLSANAVAVGGGGAGGFAGSFAVNVADGEVLATLRQAKVSADTVTISAKAAPTLSALSGAIAGAGTAAVGVGISTNVTRQTVRADVDGSAIRANGAVLVTADSTGNLSGSAVSGAASGTVSVTGSAVANSSQNTVEALVRDTDTLGAGVFDEGSDIATRGTVVVAARAQTTLSLLAGTEEAPGINASFAGGGVAGVGASVTVNTLKNRVKTGISGNSTIIGLGHGTASWQGTAYRGVATLAEAGSTITMVTANGAVGGVAGVAALFSFNQVDDSARVLIGADAPDGTLVVINPELETSDAALLAAEIGTGTANSGQDFVAKADTDSQITAVTANIAIGGAAGVGAGSGNTLATSLAEVRLGEALISARDNIDVDAVSTAKLEAVTLGLAGGFVGVTANAGVNRIGAQALITLDGATLDAGNDLTLDTHIDANSTGFTGAAAGGAVGASGGVQVTLFDTTSKISVGEGVSARSGAIRSGDDTRLQAKTDLVSNGSAVSGAAGGAALALAANITLIEAETTVSLGDDQVVSAGGSLTLRAKDSADINSIAGSVGIGATGGGISFDYVNFAGSTQVLVGQGVQLEADSGTSGLQNPLASTGNILLDAESTRDVDSGVVAASLAGISVSGAISIIEMGALAEDEDDKRSDYLANAQTELSSNQQGNEGVTGDNRDNTAGNLTTLAGADSTTSEITSQRQAINLTDAPGEDVVKVSVGAGATLLSRGSVDVNANVKTAVKQLAGAGSASLFGGASSGTAVANVGTGAAILVGEGARIGADGRISLDASTGAITGRDLVNSKAATLAASAGYSAGVGVSVATLSGHSTVDVARGATLGGQWVDRAALLSITADRSGTLRTDTYNLSVSVVGGVGVAVSSAVNKGQSAIRLGQEGSAGTVTLKGDTLTLSGDDTSRTVATGEGSSGGIAVGANAVIISATGESTGTLAVANSRLQGGTVTLQNQSAASASAEARGIAVGAVAIGAAVAEADQKFTLATDVSATIQADALTLRTKVRKAGFEHAKSVAASTSGGILAGNGAEARAYSRYSVTADYTGTFTVGGKLAIATDASQVTTKASTTGRSGGVVAVGLTMARAGQDADAETADKVAKVSTTIENATLRAGTLEISTGNAPDARADADSGSGGLVSGSGAETWVHLDTSATTTIGATGAVLLDAGTLQISTGQAAKLGSHVDTVSAAAIGKSGALSDTSVTTASTTRIGGNTTILADNIDLAATTAVTRPEEGFNIVSGSGGALDIPAMRALVTVSSTTDLFVDDGASLTQTALTGTAQSFKLGTFTDMGLTDRQKLDAGGAIAIPIGNSKVTVAKNDATVTIGSAQLTGLKDITLYSGGNATLKAEVDSTSYGLAGAATGKSYATYNADNRVKVGDGARIEALNDIRLQAGYGARQAQTVSVNAETRVFNKTAIPIPTDPVADAAALTASVVDVQKGANVIAVRDVYLLAEAGGRDVLGYGRGKDLYREVAAEIGSAISEAFGGDPVSLDIESGTSTDTSDDGILVNGYVRAGSRNKQILLLDKNNQLDNVAPGLGYTNDMADGITWSLEENVALSARTQERIDLLNSLIADPTLSQDAAAVTAWEAERDVLILRAAQESGTADFIHLDDIIAAEGNIILRADYVDGSGFTGTLDAPGNAEIVVHTRSDAYISTAAMVIPENAGGRITFNDVVVKTPADISALSDPLRDGPSQYNMISGSDAGEPKIEVVTYGTGSIIVGGDISNADGLARFNSNQGDLDVRADISAKTVELSAGRDFVQGYTVGFTEIEGDPREIYESYFDTVEDRARNVVFGGLPASGEDGGPLTYRALNQDWPFSTVPDFTLAPRKGRIRAGRNVYITADKLNINGLIQAGTGSFDVNIDAGLDTFLDSANYGVKTVLYDPSEPVNATVVRNPNITSDVLIEYDPTGTDANGNVTGKIIVAPMVVQGGRVELTGEVFSTGGGEIRSLDGFGSVNVTSASALPVELGRIDLGELGEAGQGIEGVVRITDTSRHGADGEFYITEFHRAGSTFRQLDNTTYDVDLIDYDDDGTTDLTRVLPTHVVSTSTSGGGRSGSYATRENIDLVLNRSESVSQQTKKTQTTFYFWAPLSKSIKSKPGKVTSKDLPASVAPGLNGVYLADRDPSATYAYSFSAQAYGISTKELSSNTDDKRFLGIGDVVKTWTDERTATLLYTHRLKADYGVKITFQGKDTGGLNLVNTGDIALTGAVNNEVGHSVITSSGGSVITTDSAVQLSIGSLDVAALGGHIDGLSSAFRVDQRAGTVLNATARDSINIRELHGTMTVGNVHTTNRSSGFGTAVNGQVKLQSEGSILAASDTSRITGSSIELRSTDGGFGTDSRALKIHEDGAGLVARARNAIYLEEVTGDLNLNTVTSDTSSVEIVVNAGAVLDRNDIELRDSRTEAELAALWIDQLQLNDADGSTQRRAAQIAALKTERERLYAEYWQARQADGGAAQSFALEAGVATSLTGSGWTQAQLDAYVDERDALYATWNGESAFDPNYSYLVTLEDQASVTEGIEWSVTQLNEWLRAGLIRGTGDTNLRVENPNISAPGDITLIARDRVGELLPEVTLGTDRTENLRILATAERADITIDNAAGTVKVRQAEDLNFAFTKLDTNGYALGKLRVSSADSDIFLAAETPATIAALSTPGDITLRTDGALIDARDGAAAVEGSDIVVESGQNAAIGTASNPLTFNVLPGGSLIARSGTGVYIHGINDLPLQEVFSGGPARITAQGAITDDEASGAVRVRAETLVIDGGSVGTEAAPLVIELTGIDTGGTLSLTTRTGDAWLTAQGDLPLTLGRISGGGGITTTGSFGLLSDDTLRFGTGETLALTAASGFDLTASTGTDIAGGTLTVTSGGAMGGQAKRLQTALEGLSFSATGTAPTPLWVNEADGLAIGTITQLHEDADTDIIALGPVSIGTVTSAAEFRLRATAVTEGTITAARTELAATGTTPTGGIGDTTRLEITTGALSATTADGSITLALNGGTLTDVEQITAGGVGAVDLLSRGTPLHLLTGPGITTEGGTITARLTSLASDADILSNGGAVDIAASQTLAQSAGTRIDSGAGTLRANVTGNMQVAQLSTTNAGTDALRLTVGGTLSVAPGQTATNLVANAPGALTTLRLGALAPTGPLGLTTALAELDSVVSTGDTHLNETDGLILTSVSGTAGLIDIFTRGRTEIGTLTGAADAPIIVSSDGGDIVGDGAVISGGDVRLFAFSGAMAGLSSDTFTGDTADGTTLHLLARDDLRYTETAGNLRVGFAMSDLGDLEISATSGTLEMGVLGAGGTLNLSANGDLNVNIIGRATVDLADELALELVEPDYYGLHEAASPKDLSLTALGTGSRLYGGLVNAKDTITLLADEIDVHLYDATGDDGLDLTISDPAGDFSELVDVQSIGDGPVLFMSDFFEDVRPRLGNRPTSQGDLTLSYGRIGTGQVTHAGPFFEGLDVAIDGDVWFRQRSFDMLAQVTYDKLSTVADAQVLTLDPTGGLAFSIRNEITLVTHEVGDPLDGSGGTVLVLNRRLGGVDLNGGQGFGFGVGVETDILAFPFTFRDARPGVTFPENLRQIDEQHRTGGTITLPRFITGDQTPASATADDDGEICVATYSQEPCLLLSSNTDEEE